MLAGNWSKAFILLATENDIYTNKAGPGKNVPIVLICLCFFGASANFKNFSARYMRFPLI